MQNHEQESLAQDGYLLLRGMLSPDQINALRERLEELWRLEGSDAGAENYKEAGARRLANLANKDAMFRALICDARVLEAVEAVIGPDIRLNMLNARDALPHSQDLQPLHADTDQSGLPDARGYYVCTAIWMLDDFTRANGATRFVPGSHRSAQVPKQVLADVFAPHPAAIVIQARAGEVLVFNGHAWHAGGANTTDASRHAILIHYVRGDKPQRLDYKQAIAPEVQAQLTPRERQILGVR